MVDPVTLNVFELEHQIRKLIDGHNASATKKTFIAPPDAAFLHELARWAKAFAIWISHEKPTYRPIANIASEYVQQHYGLMLPIHGVLAQETVETCFNLAIDAGLEILAKAKPEDAIRTVLVAFETEPKTFRRQSGTAPREDWQTVWDRYHLQLV